MTTRISRNTTLLAALCAVLCTILLISLWSSRPANAAAPSGLSSTVGTTSRPVVNSTAALVFATSTTNQCAARVISTASSSIMITFSDLQGSVPNAAFGFYQPASSTVAYDGGVYGCGAVRIYSFATQQITVMETR